MYPGVLIAYPTHTLPLFPRTLSPSGDGDFIRSLGFIHYLSSGDFQVLSGSGHCSSNYCTAPPRGPILQFQIHNLFSRNGFISCLTESTEPWASPLEFSFSCLSACRSLSSVLASRVGLRVLRSITATRPSAPLGSLPSGIPFLLPMSFLSSFLSFFSIPLSGIDKRKCRDSLRPLPGCS